MTETVVHTRRPDGPHPGVLALVSFVLMLTGLVVAALMSGGDTLASPFTSTAQVVAHVRDHHEAVRVAAFFQFGSAVPLAIFAATVYARQLRLGIRVPGPVISLVGGILAAASLLVASFATYVESMPEVTVEGPLLHALAFLAFVAGGPGYVVGLGLLVAGIAVPTFILRLAPRWLAGTGLALALLAELTWLGLLVEPLRHLLPVGRFLGGAWLIAIGFALPRSRRTTRDA
jgi:hypothetical protein